MILRKPYAILIKNFKLIHIILTALMGYLIYKTYSILNFFNEYLSDVATTIDSGVHKSLFGSLPIVVSIIIVIGSSIILALMMFKDKPIKFYIYNIVTYILYIIYFVITSSFVKALEISLIDIRILKILHDITTLALVLEMVAFVIVIVRSTGFDIRSFNFKKDLQDLNVEVEDNEEFEVNTEIDTNKLKRELNKKVRHFKYIYLENKLLLRIIFALIITLIVLAIYLNNSVINRKYNLNKTFKTNQFILNFTDSYLTQTDYYGNIIDEDKYLVVVRFQMNALYKTTKLDIGDIYLRVNNKNYYHKTKFKTKVSDLGETYIDQNITNDKNTYLLTFEIPKSQKNEKMVLYFVDTSNDIIKIDVTPEKLINKKNKDTAKLNDTLIFKDSPLKNTSIKINEFDINDTFELNYKYCINDNCYDSKEFVKPGTNTNHDMTILKINGELNIDSDLNSKITNLSKFIKYFGKLRYVINGEEKVMNLTLKTIKTKHSEDNNYYIEILDEVKNAEEIYLDFSIRNYVYTYKIK